MDAVLAAQAWHWVDPARAVPEVARVLAPGGTLGLVWNERDERESWVAELGRIIGEARPEEDGAKRRHGRGQDNTSDHPRVGPPFGPLERARRALDPPADPSPNCSTWWPRAVTSSCSRRTRGMLDRVRLLVETNPAQAGRAGDQPAVRDPLLAALPARARSGRPQS